MENKSLLALAATATCLLLSKRTPTTDDSLYHTRLSDHSTVTIEVLGPDGDRILMPTTVAISSDATVLSASIESFEQNQIPYQTGSSGTDKYITSINGIDQQSAGPLSGWLYKVNDIFIDAGPSTYSLNSGDRVTWIFTKDLGKDVGAPPVLFERLYYKTSFNNFHFN